MKGKKSYWKIVAYFAIVVFTNYSPWKSEPVYY